jgi:acyl-CoA thioesterase I
VLAFGRRHSAGTPEAHCRGLCPSVSARTLVAIRQGSILSVVNSPPEGGCTATRNLNMEALVKRKARFFAGISLLGTFLSLASVLCFFSQATRAQDQISPSSPAAACLAFKTGLSLGAPLPFTKAKLRAGGTLTIVALGSSSTTGFGAFGTGTPFPEVMTRELARIYPSAQIALINSGRLMENLADNIARLDRDVLSHKPDLLIWQIGTNDVVWRGIADNAQDMLSEAVRRIKAANTDIILLDLQFAPWVLANNRYDRMERIIADVANQQKVGHFPRFILMKRAIEAGVTGLVSWDGLHNSTEGYACVGVALAQMIDAAVRQ